MSAKGWRQWAPWTPISYVLGVFPVRGVGTRSWTGAHKDDWKRVLRDDPCAYCGARGGTIDHIVAKAVRVWRKSQWHDYTGACARCNQRKADRSLLFWLLARRAA